jgi:GTP cyclohydrolase I
VTGIAAYADLEDSGIAAAGQRFDLAAAATAAREFLAALGISCDSPGMSQTPERMARAYAEMFTAPPFELTTFPNDSGYTGLVVVNAIPVRSVCEHHLLPFFGRAAVGYRPADRILGLSKIARVVEMFARRPQVQERLTQQIASWLDLQLTPKGVGVVIEAEHTCMTARGVLATGSVTTTSALTGVLRDDPRCRSEFFASVRGSTQFSRGRDGCGQDGCGQDGRGQEGEGR